MDTTQYRLNTRLCKYHNLQELIALFSMIADYHKADNSDILPVFNGYQNCVVSKSPELKRYLDYLSHRAELVRKRRVLPRQDNMLQITCDGRKAALDIRLAEPHKPFSYDMKVYRCAENVFDVWASDPEYKCTQIVFCDIATPKQSFNIYDELKRLLIKMGIHESEIAFIHDADTDAKRTEIFKKVNAGKIRVLIGSTFKLGLGVNVQTYLKAVHHLDVPWRPSDMTQREGRILRPGNLNKEIKIFRYITEGSFDAYSWQLLEIKQRFISQIVSGEYADRSGDEVDNTALTYGEVKALAVGNPLIRARVETANELSKYRILQKKLAEHYEELRIRCTAIPAEIEQAADARLKCEADFDYLKQNPETLSPAERRAVRNAIDACIRTNAKATEETPICSYCGFSLSVPANMIPEHPVILLRRTGKYPVELGESAQGYLARIDNYLAGLPKLAENLSEKIMELQTELEQSTAELQHQESYLPQIVEYTEKLEQIDHKLGVNHS